MSLTLAYEIARGGLSTSSAATSVVSRNIARADDPDASRKSISVVSIAGGGARVDGIGHAVDQALLDSVLETTSAHSAEAAVGDAVGQLGRIVGDPALGISPAALIGDLKAALQTAASAPHDESVARSVVAAATTVAQRLNEAAGVVEGVRADANAALLEAAGRLQGLLSEFESANNSVITGTVLGRDVSDAADRRNGLLREISGLIEVRATTRTNDDVVLFAANGATLFETTPRSVTVDAGPLAAGQPGGALRIDGVPAAVAGAGSLGGRMGGLLEVRDTLAVTAGRQLDEIARGLIVAFSESDQSPSPTLPDLAGLFTYGGGPALPASGIAVDGLAAAISVNASVDPAQGGDLTRLRDGGIALPGHPSYVSNAGGEAGYGDRIRELVGRLDAPQPFDARAALGASTSVLAFAADSAGWLEQVRQQAAGQVEDRRVLNERATAAWQGRVGVNLDEELTTLIALERSYQASSRLITTINSMLDALMRATG